MTGSSNFLKLHRRSSSSPQTAARIVMVGRGRYPTKEEKIATLVHGASRVVTTKDELLYS